MSPLTVLVKNADRMMLRASAASDGVSLTFADGRSGTIPYHEVPEIGSLDNLQDVELASPYEVILHGRHGEVAELPWDFARHFCDPGYRARVEQVADAGRSTLGQRLRRLRTEAGLSQTAVAQAAGIGRVTLSRLEHGEQSPRYETLMALSRALGCEPAALMLDVAD